MSTHVSHPAFAIYLGTLAAALLSAVIVTATNGGSNFRAAEAAVVMCDGRAATIVGTGADDRLRGGSGDDVISGLGGDDFIQGGAGEMTGYAAETA
jgi:Ca2+-binding RTX toxin-like protein